MVVAGLITSSPIPTEVVDLASVNSSCLDLPSLPDPITTLLGSIFGYGYNNELLICGGANSTLFDFNECFYYSPSGAWIEYPHKLVAPRGYVGSTAFNTDINGNGRIISVASVAGGFERSIEYLTTNGWKLAASKLPSFTTYSCAAPINTTTYIILSGIVNNNTTKVTFYFDVTADRLTNGPPMKVGRAEFTCGRMIDPKTGRTKIVAAGTPFVNSTEILDVATGEFFQTFSGGKMKREVMMIENKRSLL